MAQLISRHLTPNIFLTSLLIILVPAGLCGQIKLNPEGYFETPGFAFLLYHNDYLVGKRGGLQMFLHGKRVLDAGEVVCTAADGISYSFETTEIGARTVDLEKDVCVLPGRIKPLDIGYRIVAKSDGGAIVLTVKLDKPLDWKRVRSFLLKLEVYPAEYAHKTYRGGTSVGVFSERYQGKTLLIPAASEISVAPEDGLRSFRVSSDNAELRLLDGRAMANFAGHMIQAFLPAGSPASTFSSPA